MHKFQTKNHIFPKFHVTYEVTEISLITICAFLCLDI